MTQLIKLTLHTNAGTKLETYVESAEEEDVEDIATGLADELQETDERGRHVTRWMAIGHLTIFSGAICALEVDIHDAPYGEEGSRV